MPQQRPIDRAFFREAPDGATVFFPWGLTHRGYRLPDEAAKRKASLAASFLTGSTVGVGVLAAYALAPLLESGPAGMTEVFGVLAAPGAALLLVVGGYATWVSRFVERFPASDLTVSREERLHEAAELVEPWQVALLGAVTCGLSGLLTWLQPRAWWLGLLGLALGVGMLFWSSVLRRAASGPRR